jgi:N-acetylmuramoyl-L-alanine amidase
MKRFGTKHFLRNILQVLILGVFILLNTSTVFSKPIKSAKAEALYKKAKLEYYSLLKFSNSEIRRAKWIKTANKFKEISLSFPQTISGYKALFTSAKLYQKSFARFGRPEDIKEALAIFQQVASMDKDGYLGDDALFHAGELFIAQNNLEAATLSFQTILSFFPKGDMVKRAQSRLEFVKGKKSENSYSEASRIRSFKNAVTIKEVSFNAEYSKEWLTIKTDNPIPFTESWVSSNLKYVIDLPGSKISNSVLKNIKINGNHLKRIRVTPISKAGNRVALEFTSPKNLVVKAFQKKNLIKILIQPKRKIKKSVTKPQFLEAKVTKPLQSIAKSGSDKLNNEKRKWKVPFIVVDPGHGGKDNGAIGQSGLLEKNLNLAISKRLTRILQKKYSYRVSMTREDDRFIALDERGKIANEKDADLFVSIHVNAAKRKGAHGIETYYLGRGSSDRARDTAKRENGELVYKVPDNDVQRILTDMITNRKINDSSILARWIQDKLFLKMSKKYSIIKNLGVKEGPFFVLHSTKMPSVLVEVGFITNPKEELRLGKSQYLNKLAESIAFGISSYIKDNKPTI